MSRQTGSSVVNQRPGRSRLAACKGVLTGSQQPRARSSERLARDRRHAPRVLVSPRRELRPRRLAILAPGETLRWPDFVARLLPMRAVAAVRIALLLPELVSAFPY